ncbi:hypothetical protein IH575_03295 [Candidatus Dojkabacteria bacterium]|nr:hypothetical protein [Candidatus Dojkabacteria bacterium]
MYTATSDEHLPTPFVAPLSRKRKKFRPFQQARKFVRNLGLKNQQEWAKYRRGQMPEKGNKPDDIPAAPHVVYKNKGWVGWGNWLGTGTVSTHYRKYQPFQRARKFVRNLGLKNQREWAKYRRGQMLEKGKKPKDIPSAPDVAYKDRGWAGWGNWLGTGTVATRQRAYRPFPEARQFIQNLELLGELEWRKYCKGMLPKKGEKPDDIPASPARVYKTRGWTGWGDWLGTRTVATRLRSYRPFLEAREFVHRLGLKSHREWVNYCRGHLPGKGRKPENIPAAPNEVYKDQGWIRWADWIGTSLL